MQGDALKEHLWLERLAGEWTYEMEAKEADGTPVTDSGRETVRAIGGGWIMCEARSTSADSPLGTAILTLGYDPAKARFVGTFISSYMTHLWIYEGQLDDAGTTLSLSTEGPSYTDDGTTAPYLDTIELRGDDVRVMKGTYQAADGTWREMTNTTYRRAG